MAQESCNLDKEEAEILKPSSSSFSSPLSSPSPPPLFSNSHQEFSAKKHGKPDKTITQETKPKSQLGNRCLCCRRRVGLTGFRCRCGELFCGQHWYSETHNCSFDFRALGKVQISKANPLVRAAKIIKI